MIDQVTVTICPSYFAQAKRLGWESLRWRVALLGAAAGAWPGGFAALALLRRPKLLLVPLGAAAFGQAGEGVRLFGS